MITTAATLQAIWAAKTKNKMKDLMNMKQIKKERYDFSAINAALVASSCPIIAGHVSPDEDSVGSALALAMGLRRLGKEPQVVFKDDLPSYLSFLPDIATVVKPEQLDERRDLLVMVDCAAPKRIGTKWSEPWLAKVPVIAIDHHSTAGDFECPMFVDSNAAANSQIIYYLLEVLGVEIDLPIATCLFAGISGDTGGFRYANTNSETMEIAGRLMDLGVDTQKVRMQLFESRPMKDLAMLGVALQNMEQTADKLLVWTTVSLAEKEAHGADDTNCENISAYTLHPAGVKVGVFFQEMPEDFVKISFRCREGYDVARVAQQFDGGGHVVAAGCRTRGSLDKVKQDVLLAVAKMIIECEDEIFQKELSAMHSK